MFVGRLMAYLALNRGGSKVNCRSFNIQNVLLEYNSRTAEKLT